MNIYHVERSGLKQLEEPYKFFNCDIYAVEEDSNFWIWLGSKSNVDGKRIVAWASTLFQEQNKKFNIKITKELEEPPEFKKNLVYEVVEGITPCFLKFMQKKIELDYHLYKVKRDEKGDLKILETTIDYNVFKSDEIFVIDGEKEIFVWIGKRSTLDEEQDVEKILQQIEKGRKYNPIVFRIKQEEEPEGFNEFVTKIAYHKNVLGLRKVIQSPKEEEKQLTKEEKKKKKWF